MRKSDRIHYLDIAKGIGIYLVVLGHVTHSEWLWYYIWQFHMPLFFFISGLLYTPKESFKAFLIKRTKSLYIPYVIFFLVTFAYWVLIERKYRGAEIPISYELIGLPYGTYEGGHLFFNGVIWFLPCLYVTEIIFYFIAKLKDRIGIFAGIICSFSIGQFFLLSGVDYLPFGLHTAFNAILFYGIGYLFKPIFIHLNNKNKKHQVLFLIGCLAIQLLYLGKYVSNIKVCTIPYSFLAFAGIGFYLILSNLLNKNRVIEYFGRNSLVILGLHAPIMRAIIFGATKITHIGAETLRQNVFFSISISIVILLIMLVFTETWRKYVKPMIV